MSGKESHSTPTITPEEMHAVFCNQASFIQSAAGCKTNEELLSLFETVNRFYSRWGINRVARVEISLKISPKGIDRERYAVPVNPYFEMNTAMMRRVLVSMDTPPTLLERLVRRHGGHIRMGIGIDRDRGIKKVYFSEGEKSLFAYGFREDGKYGAKTYKILRNGKSVEVMTCLRSVFGATEEADALAALFAESDKNIIYDRFALADGWEQPSGFHISPSKKMRIAALRESLTRMAYSCCPKMELEGLESWFEAMSEGYLFWLGFGKERTGGIEMSLYLRNIDG